MNFICLLAVLDSSSTVAKHLLTESGSQPIPSYSLEEIASVFCVVSIYKLVKEMLHLTPTKSAYQTGKTLRITVNEGNSV